jgi:hypothetical protein
VHMQGVVFTSTSTPLPPPIHLCQSACLQVLHGQCCMARARGPQVTAAGLPTVPKAQGFTASGCNQLLVGFTSEPQRTAAAQTAADCRAGAMRAATGEHSSALHATVQSADCWSASTDEPSHLASVLSHDCTDNCAQSAVLWASFDCVLGHHLGPVRQGCPLQPSNLQDTANTHRPQHTCFDMCTRGVGCMQHTNKAKRQMNHTLAQQHTKTLLDLSHQLHLAAM